MRVRGVVAKASLIIGTSALYWAGLVEHPLRAQASAALAVDALTPTEIFSRARDAWASPESPTQIKYTVTTKGLLSDGRETARHYAGFYDSGDDSFQVSRFSDEEESQPTITHGINVELVLTLNGETTLMKRVSRDPAPTDILGFPSLSPRYSFGIAHSSGDSAENDQQSQSKLRVIGRVSIERPHYAITLLGTDSADGVPAYHLALTPLSDAKKYRLREMWVDRSTFETRRIRIDGNFNGKPSVDVTWMVTFQTLNHVQYLHKEESEAPIVWKRVRYTKIIISFDDLAAASTALPTVNFHLPDADGELSEP